MKRFLYLHLNKEDCFEYLLINTDNLTTIMRDKELSNMKINNVNNETGGLCYEKEEILQVITNVKHIHRFFVNMGIEAEFEADAKDDK